MRVTCPTCKTGTDLDDTAAGALIRCRACGRSFVAPKELATTGQRHTLTQFNVAGLVLLHFVTVGFFPVIHLGLMHDRLPRIRKSDPNGFVAVALCFVPFVNLVWFFFVFRSLCLRINEQRRFAGLKPNAPQTLAFVVCTLLTCGTIGTILPITGWVVLGATVSVLVPVFLATVQASVNELVAATSRTPEPALEDTDNADFGTQSGAGPGDRDVRSSRERRPVARS